MVYKFDAILLLITVGLAGSPLVYPQVQHAQYLPYTIHPTVVTGSRAPSIAQDNSLQTAMSFGAYSPRLHGAVLHHAS
jgi:hypothetical protein